MQSCWLRVERHDAIPLRWFIKRSPARLIGCAKRRANGKPFRQRRFVHSAAPAGVRNASDPKYLAELLLPLATAAGERRTNQPNNLPISVIQQLVTPAQHPGLVGMCGCVRRCLYTHIWSCRSKCEIQTTDCLKARGLQQTNSPPVAPGSPHCVLHLGLCYNACFAKRRRGVYRRKRATAHEHATAVSAKVGSQHVANSPVGTWNLNFLSSRQQKSIGSNLPCRKSPCCYTPLSLLRQTQIPGNNTAQYYTQSPVEIDLSHKRHQRTRCRTHNPTPPTMQPSSHARLDNVCGLKKKKEVSLKLATTAKRISLERRKGKTECLPSPPRRTSAGKCWPPAGSA